MYELISHVRMTMTTRGKVVGRAAGARGGNDVGGGALWNGGGPKGGPKPWWAEVIGYGPAFGPWFRPTIRLFAVGRPTGGTLY